jgi:hypothetical protein
LRYFLTICVLSLSAWAQAPNGPYVVQACHNVGAGTISSLTCVFGQNVVSGNVIIAGYDYFAGTSPSIADTRTTTYTSAQTVTAADGIHQVITSGTLGSSGANTVTLSITSGTFVGIWAVEVKNSTATKDVCATALDFSGTPASVSSNSATTTKNGEFAVAFASGLQNGGRFSTVTAPFTMFAHQNGNDSRAAAYQITGTNGSYSATFANVTNVSGSTLLCAFGPAALSVISPSVLPDAAKSVAYSYTLQANGGTGSYTWSITSGSLQSGLSLNTSTGEISGTPTNGGNNSITFKVIDGAAVNASKAVTLKVTTAMNAASFVQGKANGASPAQTFTSNVTSGNVLIVACQNSPFNNAGASWQPPTDSLSTPFYIVDSYWLNFGVGTGNALFVWWGQAPSGGADTVTCNGVSGGNITIAEFAAQPFVDAHAVTIGSGATGSVTITSSSLSTIVPNEPLYSAGFVYGGSNTAVVAPLVTCCTRANVQTDAGSQVVTTVTGYTESFTTASATDGHWVIDLLALRPPSNGSTAPVTSGGAKSQIF